MTTVCVAGLGYVGLVTAAGLTELGHQVSAVEIDRERLAALRRGCLPLHEPSLLRLVVRHLSNGRLAFGDDYASAVSASDVTFIAVHTPSAAEGEPDTTFVFRAVRSVLQHAGAGHVIVLKSTVPVGTGDQVAQLANAFARHPVDVVSNPEFLRQGSAVRDFLKPERIVVGSESDAAGDAVARLYDGVRAPVIRCSRRSAELAKYAANGLLATRVSYMNEVAAVCAGVGADVDEVTRIVGSDRRIGKAFLQAGLGWGGSCLPKDVLGLTRTAVQAGFRPAILDAAFNVNAGQRERAVALLRDAVAGVERPVVAVLGLAFKPRTDDTRGSPALDIIGRLLEEDVAVRAHDPAAMDKAARALPEATYCRSPVDAATGSDTLLLATEWPQYLKLDWRRMRLAMRGDAIVDGRNALDGEALRALGFRYLSFGRRLPGEPPAGQAASSRAVVRLVDAKARPNGRQPAALGDRRRR